MKRYFVTGIGTDVGKTIVSAILTETLKADYWKPVQAGDLDNTDTMKVKKLISNKQTVFYPEAYRLTQPMSPHAAAKLDHTHINPHNIIPPEHSNTLIIEGAGGLLVPLNNNFLIIDLIAKLNAEVILVSRNYLGSINHTLLSVQALTLRNIPVAGIIFNGEPVKTTQSFISRYTGLKPLFHVMHENKINRQTVCKYADKLKRKLHL